MPKADEMSKKAHDKIATGLNEALAVARGKAKPSKLHEPARASKRKEVIKQPQAGRAAPSTAVALAQAYSPAELVHLAVLQKADVAVIERLSMLAERWESSRIARDGLIAFNNAIADLRPELPVIKKNRRVFFESKKPGAADTDYRHEDLAGIAEAVDPVIGKHGLSYRWRYLQPSPGQVTVTCILSHRAGHFEENSLTCAVDTSGNKNHIQAIASATTYLERYTLKGALGIASRHDDDGRAAGDMDPNRISEEVISGPQVDTIVRLLKQKGRAEKKFLDWCGVNKLEEIPLSYYDDCIATLEKMSDAE